MTVRVPRSLVLRRGTVLDTYPGLGFGNYLYFALQAHIGRRRGRRMWVLDSGLDVRWTQALPRLRALLAEPRGARFRRRRHLPERFYQDYGTDFDPAQLADFLAEVVLPARPEAPPGPDLVVNVRRGDYYSNPGLAKIYAFDVEEYVRAAVVDATTGHTAEWLCVVSDDAAWCRTHLGWLSDSARRVTFGARHPGPVGDFWEVAGARRLVLTNSTFSYWAAYTSQAVHGGEHGGVWVPGFHQRNIDDGRPWQHAPDWHAVPASPSDA